MKALTFTIELLESMLATGLEGDPNAGVSQNFVAGSVLRGAIIGLYLRAENLPELRLDNHERELFFNGKVCYLNAYPQIKINHKETKRSLPVLLSWQKVKDADDKQGLDDFCFAKRDKDKQYKDIDSPFFIFDNSKIIKVKPDTRLAVHTRRDARKGRSTSDDGAVFRYESIVARTKFGGVIIGDETWLAEINGLIDRKEVLLGGSRTAGYGRAKICNTKIEDWSEDKKAVEVKPSDPFTITLLSNALIRDVNGQFQANLTAENLGINARLCEKQTFKRGELVGGFNRKWGLPLPQQLSIKAGSVFKFIAQEDIDESTIQTWLDQGIGERRVDGFGRIAVNLNNADKLYFDASEPDKIQEVKLTGASATARTLAQKMNERILRQKFETKLIAQVGSTNIEGKEIRKSQISRLRLVVREAIRAKDQTKIQNFFENLKKTARDQFDGAKIEENGNKSRFQTWLYDILQGQGKLEIGESAMPGIGGLTVPNALLNDLKLEYHLRLIDGVLARAAKDNQR